MDIFKCTKGLIDINQTFFMNWITYTLKFDTIRISYTCGRGGMVDTHASGACDKYVVRVQISSSAPYEKQRFDTKVSDLFSLISYFDLEY